MTEETDIEPLLTISNSPCDEENQIHKSNNMTKVSWFLLDGYIDLFLYGY
jgi:hypothetical protein